MAEFFMRKLPVNPPALAFIKLNGSNIGLDHAKTKCFMATTAYLKFRLLE